MTSLPTKKKKQNKTKTIRVDFKCLQGKSNGTGTTDVLTAFTFRVCFSAVSKNTL